MPEVTEIERLNALRGSIKSWQKKLVQIRKGFVPEITIHSCPLCTQYHPRLTDEWDKGCEYCPIALYTGRSFCEGTPCDQISLIHPVAKLRLGHTFAEARRLALEELKFLRKLLHHYSEHSTPLEKNNE